MVDNNLTDLPLLNYEGGNFLLKIILLMHPLLFSCFTTAWMLLINERVNKSNKKENNYHRRSIYEFPWKIYTLRPWLDRKSSQIMDSQYSLIFFHLCNGKKFFDCHELEINDIKRVYQFPFSNITNQVYFEVSKK